MKETSPSKISPNQKRIYQFILQFIDEQGYAPSVREVASELDFKSTSGVHRHIWKLKELGLLRKEKKLSRSIIPSDSPKTGVNVLGYITAGHPVEAASHPVEHIPFLPSTKNSQELYALEVVGLSMVEVGIIEGDYVIINPEKTASNGDMVVALVQGKETTLKRFFLEKDQVRLQPANKDMKAMYYAAEDVEIQGVVVGVWRSYSKQEEL